MAAFRRTTRASAVAPNEFNFFAMVTQDRDFLDMTPHSRDLPDHPRPHANAEESDMLKIDTYTKAVLTVIAACLLWMCVMDSGPAIQAQQSSTIDAATFAGRIQPVVIVGTGTMNTEGVVSVNFVRRGAARTTDPTLAVSLPYSADAPLPVRLPYSAASPMPAQLVYSPQQPPFPVAVTGVRRSQEWDPIRVDVEDAPLRRTPGR